MDYTYHRIFGYTTAMLVQTANLSYLAIHLPPKTFDDPNLVVLKNLQPRFFTIWNVIIQIIYSAVSLWCEISTLKNSEKGDFKLSKYVRRFRDVLFSSVMWPSTWVVAIVFWTLYNYDRDLIFPKHTEQLLNPVSNHIMHTLIVPFAIWELVYRQRREPKTHRKYFYHLVFHFALYFVVITYTFIERGIWIYPIFTKLYGTIFFPLIHISICAIALSAYFIQWPLSDYIWQQGVKKVN
ncbi:unnamed protein product [Leptosia nina]|uniref:Androgen-dependent TFPI-regulating protein n=1 Tax=Leptosia nina TaxID=320188 RepID=A0AAV1JJU4_9NEOP